MNKLKLFFLVFILISCSRNDKIIEGDLAFKTVDFSNYYGLNQNKIDKFDGIIDSMLKIKNPSNDDLSFLSYMDNLKKYNVIKSPYIRLKTKDSIIIVYLKENDFEKVKNYNSNDLISNNRKINFKMKIETRGKEIYYCKELISIKEVHGKTYTSK
jgi:hypothetical protein